MRKSFLTMFVFSVIVANSLMAQSQNRIETAKTLIRTEFKNNMNDYASYQPVSYSKLDSLFTNPYEDEKFVKLWINPVIEALNDLEMPSLKITSDVNPIIEKIKENPSKYKDDILPRLEIFNISQELMYDMIDTFIPEFVGWKIVHKYRAKNLYNATVLHEDEFRFDKGLTKVTSYKPADN